MSGVHLQVRRCARMYLHTDVPLPIFHISETAERIALKLDVRLETFAIIFTQEWDACARAYPFPYFWQGRMQRYVLS